MIQRNAMFLVRVKSNDFLYLNLIHLILTSLAWTHWHEHFSILLSKNLHHPISSCEPQLYMKVCPSIGAFVCWAIGLLVCWSVMLLSRRAERRHMTYFVHMNLSLWWQASFFPVVLVACTQLCKPRCWLVGPSVNPSVTDCLKHTTYGNRPCFFIISTTESFGV